MNTLSRNKNNSSVGKQEKKHFTTKIGQNDNLISKIMIKSNTNKSLINAMGKLQYPEKKITPNSQIKSGFNAHNKTLSRDNKQEIEVSTAFTFKKLNLSTSKGPENKEKKKFPEPNKFLQSALKKNILAKAKVFNPSGLLSSNNNHIKSNFGKN